MKLSDSRSVLRRVVLLGVISVLAFDTVGAVAASAWDFDYGSLLPGSLAIYAMAGFLASRVTGSRAAGLIVGGIVAVVDATLGWAIAWAIGPGDPGGDSDGPVFLAATVVLVTLVGAVLGWIAGAVATRFSAQPRET